MEDLVLNFLLHHHDKNNHPRTVSDEEHRTAIISLAALIKRREVSFDVPYPYTDKGELPTYLVDLIHMHGVLDRLVTEGRSFNTDTPRHAEIEILRGCHVATALNWVLRQDKYDICSGISEYYHAHSWLVLKDTDLVVEPTPVPREYYFGVLVNDPVEFVKEELPGIIRLNEKGVIQDDVMKDFLLKMETL